jgi:hypothetical protein
MLGSNGFSGDSGKLQGPLPSFDFEALLPNFSDLLFSPKGS